MSNGTLAEAVTEAMRYIRSGEQLIGIAGVVGHAAQGLGNLAESDPELAPEIGAALTKLREANEAITQAVNVADVRRQLAIDKVDPGGEPT